MLGTILSCTYTLKIRDGKTAFERKQFSVASKFLSQELEKSKNRSEKGKIAFMLAESYRQLGKNENAIPVYKQAYDNGFGSEALRQYAFSLKKSQQYKEAAEAFKQLGIEIGSPYEYRKEITACTIAEEWLKNTQYNEYVVENQAFNSAAADYAPAMYQDGQLVFTSDRNAAEKLKDDNIYRWTGRQFSDLYVVNPAKNQVQKFDNQLNTQKNEGTASFSADGKTMVFSRCYSEQKGADSYCKLMIAKKGKDSWEEPEILPFSMDEKVNFAHPALSQDGNILYFSCNKSDGWGGFDLYICDKKNDAWQTPRLLSRNINSTANEMYPSIDADTLYFASDGLTGMGGLDIFKTYKTGKDTWSPPQNMKSPINSSADDFALVVDNQTDRKKGVFQKGYFTSNRTGGKGGDDIYAFEKRTPPNPPAAVVINTPKDTVKAKIPVYKLILDGYVVENIYEIADNPNSRVIGHKPLKNSVVSAKFGNNEVREFVTGEDGYFTLELRENIDYSFAASCPNYLKNDAKFSTRGIGKDPDNPTQRFELEILLDKIFTNKEIVLENIYYDFDKWDIRDDARPSLDKLAGILDKNPSIKIQLSSHTDCRGNDRYNEELSQRRAQSAVEYLIGRSIKSERLVAKGYGESSPAVVCVCQKCTEEQYQANRRTTFKILE